MEISNSQAGWIFPTQLNLILNILFDTPRGLYFPNYPFFTLPQIRIALLLLHCLYSPAIFPHRILSITFLDTSSCLLVRGLEDEAALLY